MKGNTPRRKRLNKKTRLVQASEWIKSYTGKNLVKGYSKWLGVDLLCALRELKLAGAPFTQEAEQRIVRAYEQRMEDKARRKRKLLPNEAPQCESDENFAFIAGYTSNGFPYGVAYQSEQDEDTDPDLPLPW